MAPTTVGRIGRKAGVTLRILLARAGRRPHASPVAERHDLASGLALCSLER